MQTQAREFDLLSSVDTLMAVGEPFGLHLHLWGAKKKKIKELIKSNHPELLPVDRLNYNFLISAGKELLPPSSRAGTC